MSAFHIQGGTLYFILTGTLSVMGIHYTQMIQYFNCAPLYCHDFIARNIHACSWSLLFLLQRHLPRVLTS